MTTFTARAIISTRAAWRDLTTQDQFQRITAAAPGVSVTLATRAALQGRTLDPTTLRLSVETLDDWEGAVDTDVVTILAAAEAAPPSPIQQVLALMQARENDDFVNNRPTQWHYSTAPLPEVLAILADAAQSDSTTHPDAYAMADRILAALEQPTDAKADTNAKAEPW